MEVREPSAKYLLRPQLRQTDIGLIPEDWQPTTIGDVAIKVGSGITPRGGNANYKRSGRPFVRSQNVGWGALLLDDLVYIEESVHSTFVATELKEGDVLLNITGASIGRSAIANSQLAGGNVNQHVCIVRTNASSVESRFINYFLLSKLGQRQIDSFQAGGNREGLNFGQIRSLKLALPPEKAEQEAIAEALNDADALIESLEQLIAKKRQLKQGVLQELLTGKSRLPGFCGNWQTTRLGDLGATFGGLTGKTKSDFGDGTSRYITFMNIMTNVVIDCERFEQVNVSSTESQNRVLRGDLFFNGSSETPEEVGMCSVLTADVQDVYLNSFCFGFRFRDEEIADGLYLAYYFRSDQGRELLKSLAQGATRYNLSKAALLKVEFPLPPPSEQAAIAIFLSDMDSEIAALESKLAKARKIKQGMMQELLTGRIRLV